MKNAFNMSHLDPASIDKIQKERYLASDPKPNIVICKDDDGTLYFDDDVRGKKCFFCGVPILHRPYLSESATFVCIRKDCLKKVLELMNQEPS